MITKVILEETLLRIIKAGKFLIFQEESVVTKIAVTYLEEKLFLLFWSKFTYLAFLKLILN